MHYVNLVSHAEPFGNDINIKSPLTCQSISKNLHLATCLRLFNPWLIQAEHVPCGIVELVIVEFRSKEGRIKRQLNLRRERRKLERRRHDKSRPEPILKFRTSLTAYVTNWKCCETNAARWLRGTTEVLDAKLIERFSFSESSESKDKCLSGERNEGRNPEYERKRMS